MFDPRLFLIFFVADLIHDVEGVAAVGKDRLVQAHGILDRVHGIGNVFLCDTDLRSDLFDGGLLQVASRQGLSCVNCLVGSVLQGARNADAAVVAQETPDLTDNHRNGIGGKLDIQGRVEVIDRLDESDAADLEQIVNIFVAGGKALDDTQHQTKISLDISFSGFCVTGLDLPEQSFFFF